MASPTFLKPRLLNDQADDQVPLGDSAVATLDDSNLESDPANPMLSDNVAPADPTGPYGGPLSTDGTAGVSASPVTTSVGPDPDAMANFQAENRDYEAANRLAMLTKYGFSRGAAETEALKNPAAMAAETAIEDKRAHDATETSGERLAESEQDAYGKAQMADRISQDFGGPQATRALQRAVQAKLAMSQASDEAATTQLHEQVLDAETQRAIAQATPKYNAETAVATQKAQADAYKANLEYQYHMGQISEKEWADGNTALARLYGGSPASVTAATQAGIPQRIEAPGPVQGPAGPPQTAGLRAGAGMATGGPGAPRQFTPTQEQMIANAITAAGKRNISLDRATAISLLDQAGWK
jgi:hypothetical protein